MKKHKISFYDIFMFPFEAGFIKKKRAALIANASGKVVEIGFGTGANYRFYDFNSVDSIIAYDISLRPKDLENVTFMEGNAEKLPFADNSVDTVVATLLLCSVFETQQALAEIYRVLKPGGKYIFIEHIRPQKGMGKFFDVLNKLWTKISFGCQLNKKTMQMIENSGWLLNGQYSGFLLYYGIATKPLM